MERILSMENVCFGETTALTFIYAIDGKLHMDNDYYAQIYHHY